MAVSALNTTTLSAALAADTKEFAVGSTTNISAGNLLIVGTEAMKVNSIPSSGNVSVTRGVNGTRAAAHASGKLVYIGSPEKFKDFRDYAIGMFGDSGTLPEYLLPGSRAKDGIGNEYILCDSTTAIYSGSTVSISMDGNFQATILASTARGSVGVAVEYASASDKYIWVQIYGSYATAQETNGDSAGTSALVAIAASTASTPSVGLAAHTGTTDEVNLIYGMYITGIPTTATTSAASHTGVAYPVWLNYPYVTGVVDFPIDPTS